MSVVAWSAFGSMRVMQICDLASMAFGVTNLGQVPHPIDMPTPTVKKPAPEKTAPVERSRPTLYQRIDALLHTMRCIHQHEDSLCEFAHDLKSQGKLSATVSKELAALLETLPSHEYMDDLYAVREALVSSKATSAKTR